MAFHDGLLIHHSNGGRGNGMHNRLHGSGFRDSPCVASRSHLDQACIIDRDWVFKAIPTPIGHQAGRSSVLRLEE